MKLKRKQPVPPPTDLLDEFLKCQRMLDEMLLSGNIAQVSLSLTDARRHACVETIHAVIAQLETFARVVSATGQLAAQGRLSGREEIAFLVQDDIRIIVTPPQETP